MRVSIDHQVTVHTILNNGKFELAWVGDEKQEDVLTAFGKLDWIDLQHRQYEFDRTSMVINNITRNFRKNLQDRMLKKAREYKMEWMPGTHGGMARFRDLSMVWEDQFSSEMAEKMWNVVFGQFEHSGVWDHLINISVDMSNTALANEKNDEVCRWVSTIGYRAWLDLQEFVTEPRSDHGNTLRQGCLVNRRGGVYSKTACLVMASGQTKTIIDLVNEESEKLANLPSAVAKARKKIGSMKNPRKKRKITKKTTREVWLEMFPGDSSSEEYEFEGELA